MKTLEESRKRIDEIDNEIIKLYEERMHVVKDVINYKLMNNIAILDSNRESKMLKNNLNKIKDNDLKCYYIDVLKGFLIASKDMQKDILDSYNNKDK